MYDYSKLAKYFQQCIVKPKQGFIYFSKSGIWFKFGFYFRQINLFNKNSLASYGSSILKQVFLA